MTSSSKIKYKVLDTTTDGGFSVLEMESAPYSGVKWTYGAVSFVENDDGETVTLKYDVNLLPNFELDPDDLKLFHRLAGDILVEVIYKQIETGEVQYHGGTGKIESNTASDRGDMPASVRSDIHTTSEGVSD